MGVVDIMEDADRISIGPSYSCIHLWMALNGMVRKEKAKMSILMTRNIYAKYNRMGRTKQHSAARYWFLGRVPSQTKVNGILKYLLEFLRALAKLKKIKGIQNWLYEKMNLWIGKSILKERSNKWTWRESSICLDLTWLGLGVGDQRLSLIIDYLYCYFLIVLVLSHVQSLTIVSNPFINLS